MEKKINTLVKSEFEDPIKITTEKIIYEFICKGKYILQSTHFAYLIDIKYHILLLL